MCAIQAASFISLFLQHSWGESGFDWQFEPHRLLNASVWPIDIDTNASLDTMPGLVKPAVDISPWVYLIGAS